MTIKANILTREQRNAGLKTWEDDHIIKILDGDKLVAVFSSTGATIQEIQYEANSYLIKRGK